MPIQRVVSKNISDSLNTSRSQTKGAIVSIVGTSELNKSPYLVCGLIFLFYGAGIYVFLPTALLNSNFNLILLVFFGIIVGSIFGMTLVTSNFQSMLEIILVKIFLFWEKTSMKNLILKNLICHR